MSPRRRDREFGRLCEERAAALERASLGVHALRGADETSHLAATDGDLAGWRGVHDDRVVSRPQGSRVVAVSLVLALATASCGLIDEASSFAAKSLQTTASYVESRSTRTFLVRYVPSDESASVSVFALPPGQEGGTLFSPEGWAGRLEVLREDCSVVGSIEIEAASDTYVLVAEFGKPERVPSTEVIDAPTSATLERVPGRCGG